MAEKIINDLERLGRVYQRMRHQDVDTNNPDSIIIQLDKECEQYRDKIELRENRIKELHGRLIRMQHDLNVALNSVPFSQLETVTQESTLGEIIKATAESGYNISISLYKSGEE